MPYSNNSPIDIQHDLVDLETYRKEDRGTPDPIIVYQAYAQDSAVYQDGRIVDLDAKAYAFLKQAEPNEIVNKFGLVYGAPQPMLLHRKLADVLVDASLDLYTRFGFYTIVMDGLRTFDSGLAMERRRPDLILSGLLAKAGTSAHNRALAVDSKLFLRDGDDMHLRSFKEADEHGHLDDLDMTASSRFYSGPMSEEARRNRLRRLQAWQRASVKRRLPIANLLSEFWDDRVPGSPADIWRVLACRALCAGRDGNPATNPVMQELKTQLMGLHRDWEKKLLTREAFLSAADTWLRAAWKRVLPDDASAMLETELGAGGGKPPAPEDYLFHEWLMTIHDDDLYQAWGFRQSA